MAQVYREFVQDYKGFDIIRTDSGYDSLRYEVWHGSHLCLDCLLYSDALSFVDAWHKYFGCDKND